ncbi:MAG: amidohydrolase family protein, partial [Cyclobacteriaceae bacterium]|nr:amidohydrolase family protein [Cyclobacteriaceae bacterium]
IGNFSPEPAYVGKTLAEVAAMRNTDGVQTLMDLIELVDQQDGDESIIATSMAEEDITKLIQWPYSNICSDGNSDGLHPRGHGSFPKILRHYVREKKDLTLEEAVHKMTQQAALNLNLSKIGLIAPGYQADLVLFDSDKISDHATYQDPHALASGINWVMVNGNLVIQNGTPTQQFPGKIILRN